MSIPNDVATRILQYFEKIEKMVNSFMSAIDSLNNLDLGNAYKNLATSIKLDTEADELRREILTLIGSRIDDEVLREDFSKLLRMMDRLTEWIKEASRYLDILPYLEIPQELKNDIEKLARLDVKACKLLRNAAQALLEEKFDEVIRLATEVERIEEEADEANHAARRDIVKHGIKIPNPAIVVMLRDFIEALENATDYAEDVSDVLKLIVCKLRGIR